MNDTNYISLSSTVFYINMSEYKSQGDFYSSRIRQDKSIEEQMRLGYQGRELYEMIQNADDEKSPKVEISLEGESLYIRNWGNYPFTEVGIVSILRSFLSPKKYGKKGKGKPIGCKGLGFRSLLNWSSDICIRSNGVCCHFSEEIAKKCWDDLKQGFDQSDVLLFESESEHSCPIPLLSVTDPCEDREVTRVIGQPDTEDRCTTEIEIVVTDPNVKKDIENKIKTLPSAVLLFLKSVRKITLKTELFQRVLSRELSKGPINCFSTVRIIENESAGEYDFANKYTGKVSEKEWTVYTVNGTCEIDTDKTYEVAVAFTEGMPSSNPVYSFFPTEFVLNLPCILHGTFVLDDSRNRIPPRDIMNNYVFEKLGSALITVSKHLAQNDDSSWNAFDIVNIGGKDAELAPALAEALKGIKNERILPTIGGYSSFADCVAYSEDLANWLRKNSIHSNELIHHLIPGYHTRINSEREFFSKPNFMDEDKIKGAIGEIAKTMLEQPTVNHRCYAEFIDALQKSDIRNVDILYDSSFKILNSEETSYVVSADSEMSAPPSEMKLRIVHRGLVTELRRIWLCGDRDVTRKLNGESDPYVQISTVSDYDLSRIKDRIVQWSNNLQTSEEDIRKVLKWLYKSEKNRTNPLSNEMMLFGKDGQKHPAACLLLRSIRFPFDGGNVPLDDRWLLKDVSRDWANYFGTDDYADVESFFYNVVGVSHTVPISYEYFGKKTDYLDKARYSEAKNNIENWRFDSVNDKVRANNGYN